MSHLECLRQDVDAELMMAVSAWTLFGVAHQLGKQGATRRKASISFRKRFISSFPFDEGTHNGFVEEQKRHRPLLSVDPLDCRAMTT